MIIQRVGASSLRGERGVTRAFRRVAMLMLLALGAVQIYGCASSEPEAGPHPVEVSDAELLYATVSGDDEVLVVDAQSLEVLDRVSVGAGPAIILGTPGTEKLFTANWEGNSVSVIDTDTLAVNTIELSGRPYVIAMSADGEYVYAGINPTGIAVIDVESETVERTFPTDALAASLIVSPDGTELYVATLGAYITSGQLRSISTETGEVLHENIATGNTPAWITIHPDGSKVYSLNFLSDDITVVDTATWTVDDTFSTGVGSGAIIANVSPDGEHLWVTNHGTNELVSFSTSTHEVEVTVPLTGHPVGVALDP